VEYPNEEELRCRIVNQLNRSGQTVEVGYLWNGYLAALREWGLIDNRMYVALGNLVGYVKDDDLYQLFADAPMPGHSKTRLKD